MEKKTVFLELPADIVDELDRKNIMRDRSSFISDLLKKQLKKEAMNDTSVFVSKMEKKHDPFTLSAEINLITRKGSNLGSFNLNTVEGLEKLAKTIDQISDDPIVKMRAKRLL